MSSKVDFFEDQPQEHSLIKSNIVVDYFCAWATIITKNRRKRPRLEQRVCYADLYSGPGYFKDGTESTPLRIVREVIGNPKFLEIVECVFNDGDEEMAARLRVALEALPGVERLRYRPFVTSEEIRAGVPERVQARLSVPCMAFVDPFGYVGLSADMLVGIVKNWGCDCIFFFNYNRINSAVSNANVEDHMQQLFGEVEVAALRTRMRKMSPREREAEVLRTLKASLQARIHKTLYVETFCFRDVEAERTKHYIVGLTTNFNASIIMKDIMGRYSSSHDQGVASFVHKPKDEQMTLPNCQPRPLDELAEQLPRIFAGRRMRFEDLLQEHSVGTRYERKHYPKVLCKLEAEGHVLLLGLKPRGAFGPDTEIIFRGAPP